jgi:hypothetical protein
MILYLQSHTKKAVHNPILYLTPKVVCPVGIRDEVAWGEVVEQQFCKLERWVQQPLWWRMEPESQWVVNVPSPSS